MQQFNPVTKAYLAAVSRFKIIKKEKRKENILTQERLTRIISNFKNAKKKSIVL
jgi:hypothetical protein